MQITMGVDIGSASSKAVILKDGHETLAKLVLSMGTGTPGPEQVYQQTLEMAGLTAEDIGRTVVTGYGRLTFPHAQQQISEVTCHGKGVHFLMPSVGTIIDIGGQDAKAIKLDARGNMADFVMNDKCAAGTGRFLEVMARILHLEIDELGDVGAQSTRELSISNVCTVFAESEVISHLSSGQSVPDIVAGIHRSVAKRTAGLAMRIGLSGDVAMSGGVALNSGVVAALSHELRRPVVMAPDAQLAGAYGAAILAFEKMQ